MGVERILNPVGLVSLKKRKDTEIKTMGEEVHVMTEAEIREMPLQA